MKLLGRPADDLPELFWNLADVLACHLCEHDSVAIAVDELNWNIQIEQARQRLTRHRARKDIASDHDMVYLRSTNILEDGLQCGEVSMNVIERSDPHNRPSSY